MNQYLFQPLIERVAISITSEFAHTSSIISTISIVLSGISVVFTGLMLWYKKLKPFEIVGMLDALEFKKSLVSNDGRVNDIKILPRFWIKNIGAKTGLIEDIRMCFHKDEGAVFYSYPVSKDNLPRPSPLEIEYRWFSGLSLESEQVWQNIYPFHLLKEHYEKIIGKGKITLEVRLIGCANWRLVQTNDFKYSITHKPWLLESPPGGMSCYLHSPGREGRVWSADQ